jgi:hypothetical protein
MKVQGLPVAVLCLDCIGTEIMSEYKKEWATLSFLAIQGEVSMSAIFPKMRPGPACQNLPTFFFLGPDFGGGDWQIKMYERMQYHAADRSLGDFVAVIPCRYDEGHKMMAYMSVGATLGFQYQLEWERYYIEQAALSASRGCVAIWLPVESAYEPRTDGQPYARDTRGEIGEIRGWLRCRRDARFVIGAETGFPGLDVIQRNFSYVCGGPFPIYDTLDELARGAVRVAKHCKH